MEQKRNAPPRLMALFFFSFFSSLQLLNPISFSTSHLFFTRITKKRKREIYNFFVSFYDPTIMFILMACYLNR
ncbi:Uncharacterized protein APZ42_016596 [Daphnia magna]|uniref:Uncharacterized protein n=1 Tax=Daphnia magna TaxID=35525 RepID=A0A165AI16_9CRUS|nr:Uncharacterized protein APZ42_016596 [Daphnia magna]